MQYRPLLGGALLLCMVLAAAGAGADTRTFDTGTWGEAADTLLSPEPGTRITLRSAFIVPGSVRVLVNGVEQSPETYLVNLHLGTIRFRGDIPPGATVIVHYRRHPVLLSPVYTLRPADVSPSLPPDSVPVREATTPSRAAEVEPDLVFGGTKSVSFSTGTNRGSTLDQSLEATVEGKLTPTISVRALLSDNNLPIQPEGNTEELEYFDKVFVEMEGPNARASVGDISLENRTSTFSPLVRQLRGFSGAAWTGRARVTAAGAQAKGEFRASQFRGVTGLQGPYALLSQARTTLDVIIAGTERVYVDGQRVERGQNRDYVIDYDAGTITFTPRRLVTTDTEIAVDYEVTQEEYDRSTVFGAAEMVKLGRGVVLNVSAARESDDTDRPRSFTLSEDERDLLAAAGDDATLALTDGVAPADSGLGTYVLVPADTVLGTPEFYRFDEINGVFSVSFVEVGTGAGDYTRAGISARGVPYFEFVGDGGGAYRVGRQLPLPQAVAVATARVTRDDGTLTFDAEWNASEYDRNLLSSLDDGDNTGQAGQVRVGLERGEVWRVGVTGAASYLEERFQSLDRARPGYYYRDWNLEDVPLVGNERTSEVGVNLARASWGSLRYTLGRLDRDAFDGSRHEGMLTAGTPGTRALSVRALASDTDGDENARTRRHLTAEAAYALWAVVPGFTYGSETYRSAFSAAPDSGRAYDLVGASLAGRGTGAVIWRVALERRDTDRIDAATDAFVDERRDDTASGSVLLRTRSASQVELQVIHRRERDAATGDDRTTDLARLKAGAIWESIGLRIDADYEVSQNDVATLNRSVVFVGEGKGDYNALGEAVGKGKGAYTVVFLPTEDATPVHAVGFNLRTVWKPAGAQRGDAGGTNWILQNVSVDQTLGVREESTHEPAWEVYAMLPSALQRDDATVFGTTTLRQDWSFLDGYKNRSLTFRYLREDREDNRFEGVRESAYVSEQALRFLRSVSARFTATAEAGRRVDRRDGEGIPVGTGSRYDVEERFALVGAGVGVWTGANLDVDLRGATLDDAESGAQQRSIKVSPRLVWRLAEQVNVFGVYELAEVADEDGAAVKPIIFASEGTSQRWSLTPNLRLSRVISIFATYSGRNERVFGGNRVTEHEFRLETRAYF